jgi:hypothetical protein
MSILENPEEFAKLAEESGLVDRINKFASLLAKHADGCDNLGGEAAACYSAGGTEAYAKRKAEANAAPADNTPAPPVGNDDIKGKGSTMGGGGGEHVKRTSTGAVQGAWGPGAGPSAAGGR